MFELVTYENGTSTLKEVSSGQAMHSRVGPWQEAIQVYIEQSGLREHLTKGREIEIVLYDVGMGLATNALAALDLWGSISVDQRSALRIVSFENRPEGLKAALDQVENFPFLKAHVDKLQILLEQGEWRSECGRLNWQLKTGDFFEAIKLSELPKADVIFYDFYDPKTCPELWTVEAFKSINLKCANQSILCTYAAATPVRVAMLLAGFTVGKGKRTWAKAETTVAVLDDTQPYLKAPLGPEWLVKWEHSSKPLPYGQCDQNRDTLRTQIYKLNQFQ